MWRKVRDLWVISISTRLPFWTHTSIHKCIHIFRINGRGHSTSTRVGKCCWAKSHRNRKKSDSNIFDSYRHFIATSQLQNALTQAQRHCTASCQRFRVHQSIWQVYCLRQDKEGPRSMRIHNHKMKTLSFLGSMRPFLYEYPVYWVLTVTVHVLSTKE